MNTWTARILTSTTTVPYSEPLESYLIETNGSLTATTCTQYCKAALIKYISFSGLAVA